MTSRSAPRALAFRPAAFAAALAAVAVVAPLAHAQWPTRGQHGDGYNRAVYEWQGRVDSEIRLQLRGGRASLERVGNNETRYGSGRVLNALPRRSGYLTVRTLEGRRAADVIQQPSSSNGYTAVVRLRDPSGGAANYRVVAYWQPAQDGYGRVGTIRRP
jgi:hypothetical protein